MAAIARGAASHSPIRGCSHGNREGAPPMRSARVAGASPGPGADDRPGRGAGLADFALADDAEWRRCRCGDGAPAADDPPDGR